MVDYASDSLQKGTQPIGWNGAAVWSRLTAQPMRVVWRYVFAFLGAALAMGVNIWHLHRAINTYAAARWGSAISAGLIFGHVVAFMVIFAAEYPGRLRGIFPLWMRGLLSLIAGAIIGTLAWAAFTVLILDRTDLNWGVLALGGIGLSLGFTASVLFNLRGWLAVLITTVAIAAPILIRFQMVLDSRLQNVDALLYFDARSMSEVYVPTLVFALLIALGGHARAIWRDLRGLVRR